MLSGRDLQNGIFYSLIEAPIGSRYRSHRAGGETEAAGTGTKVGGR